MIKRKPIHKSNLIAHVNVALVYVDDLSTNHRQYNYMLLVAGIWII
jgi:hypothetical protein